MLLSLSYTHIFSFARIKKRRILSLSRSLFINTKRWDQREIFREGEKLFFSLQQFFLHKGRLWFQLKSVWSYVVCENEEWAYVACSSRHPRGNFSLLKKKASELCAWDNIKSAQKNACCRSVIYIAQIKSQLAHLIPIGWWWCASQGGLGT